MASCFQCQSQKQQEDPLCSVHCLVVCAGISLKYLSGVAMKSDSQGLPWWLSGWRSTCQCRRHSFNPWSRKIPQASEQLNPCTTICEPVLKGVWAATTEPVCHNYWRLSTGETTAIKKPFVVQSLGRVRLSATPWTAACQASLSFTISQSLFKLRSIVLVMVSNYLIICHPILLSSVFPSTSIFSNESTLCIRWPKYWSFSFSTSPSNEYSGLISFKIDWFDFFAVQGTLKSLLQYHSSNNSLVLSFIVHLSHPWKTHSFDCTDFCWQRDVSAF